MTSVFFAFWCASTSTLLAHNFSKNTQTVKNLTSTFDSHFQREMAGCTILARGINKIYSFRFFPASPLLFHDRQMPGCNLSVTQTMAYSLSFQSITSKSIIL